MCPVLTAPSSLGAVGHRGAIVPPPAQTLRSALPAAFSSLIWGDNELWRHTFFGLPRLSRDQTEKLSGRGGLHQAAFVGMPLGAALAPLRPSSITLGLAGARSCLQGWTPRPRGLEAAAVLGAAASQEDEPRLARGLWGIRPGDFSPEPRLCPLTARREGQILPCRLTLHGCEDRKI